MRKLCTSSIAHLHAVGMAMLPALAILPIAAPVAAQAGAQPTAQTKQGIVEGERETGLTVYKGIPFARPPMGALRWREPRPPLAWRGVRQANSFAPSCMQVANPAMNLPDQPVSEDCLYLNIWSPAARGARLPVLVWIHGGGFSFGSSGMPLFDGAPLARRGVIFVSIAYRLGPFGYLAHPALTRESLHGSSGNYALLDQIAALRWVRDNIGSFGGDPSKVTIMGESAGAISASGLVQSPLARGLFTGVIAQSGGNFGPDWGAMTSLKEGEAQGVRLAAALGASSLKALRSIPAETLIRATPLGKYSFTRMASLPIIDGYVLPADPVKLYRAGRFNDVPILIGNNALEGALFPAMASASAYVTEVRRHYGDQADRVLAAYPARDDAEAARSWTALKGDEAFGLAEFTWATFQQRYGRKPVFFYHFSHVPPLRPGGKPGAVHGAELPYALGTMKSRNVPWTETDRTLSDTMGAYWSNFAKYGNPNGPGLPDWPSFRPDHPTTMYFEGKDPVVAPVASQDRLRLLSELIFKHSSE